ncbi:MAG: peptidoglycan DD-metalloendopeptidase family protein [Legionellaceae bacterium]|nr:peptidoglycan DD-metalloendopeptidase family protein [Legionellaceae bacterium]
MKPAALCLLIALLGYGQILLAGNSALQDAQQRMQRLQQDIHQLQHQLQAKEKKTRLLNRELADSEKKIGPLALQLQRTEAALQRTRSILAQQEQHIQQLQTQQRQQQAHLLQHLQSRYKMDNLQILKSLLNLNQASDYSRVLTYYQYLMGSRKAMIAQLHATKHTLLTEQQRYQQQLSQHQKSRQEAQRAQKKLQAERVYQRHILQSLQQDIQQNQQKLLEYQKNEQALSALLKQLHQQSRPRAQRPFAQMRHKLPPPLATRDRQKIAGRQGMSFPGKEGEVVVAVYPGKVVFSDWLKGYGLLLIIDHGQGYMTLYAHNLALLKTNGDEVLQGEAIAQVGHSGGLRENGLYFEIRYRGKAVAAADWLAPSAA